MKIALILALCIIIIFLLISYYAYRIAFSGPTPEYIEDHEIPTGKQYEPYHDEIRRCIKRMRAYPFEEIYTTAFDNKRLYARYYHVADNAPVQILFHGYKSSVYRDLCGGSHLAMKLGCNIIVVDQRGHGKSDGHLISFGIDERKDCFSWIEYTLNRFGSETKIILSGLSMGAATVLMAADLPLPKNVIGIIADCPYSSPKAIIQKVGKEMHFPPNLMFPFVKLGGLLFGHFNIEESDAVRAVSQTDIPILLFHGEADNFVPHSMSEEIAKACKSPITFVSIPEAGHGLCYMVDPKRYEAETEKFILSILNEQSGQKNPVD